MIVCEHCGREFLDIQNYFRHQVDLNSKLKKRVKARELLKEFGW